MLTLRRGTAEEIVERHVGLVRLRVGGRPCVAFPRVTGPVCVGDELLVNTQAIELGLGSGGFDVLYANLTRGLDRPAVQGAHVMALPYTPLQQARLHVEELGGGRTDGLADDGLGALPVVCCTLHSQLVPAVSGLGDGLRVAYVQVAGGALPVVLSDALRALRAAGLVEVSIAVAPCIEADLAAVSVPSALLWARANGYDAVVASVGPGIVGTASAWGHGAVSVAEVANGAVALGGRAVLAPRVSTADPRERHAGLSHHTRAVLRLVHPSVEVAWPAGAPIEPPDGAVVVDVAGWRAACAGLPLSSMRRGSDDDPWLFAAAFAAGCHARDIARYRSAP